MAEPVRDPFPLRIDRPDDDVPAQLPPEPVMVRVAKLAGLVTAVALLCGAIVAAAFLDMQRRGATPPQPAGQVTGAEAFAVTPAGGVTEGLEPAAQRPAAPPSQVATWRPAGEQQDDPVAIVRGFYRLVVEDPKQALGMLGGSLTDTERQALAVAWRDIDQLRADPVRLRPDGMVDAAVTMTTVSGERYRMVQQLRVDPPKITDVQLLSAQRVG